MAYATEYRISIGDEYFAVRVQWPAAKATLLGACWTLYDRFALRDRQCAHDAMAAAVEATVKPMRPGETRTIACPGTCSNVSITRDVLYTDSKPKATSRAKKLPEAGKGYTASVGLKEIYRFKSQWRCHGFPDNLARAVFHFEANGDLVDAEYMKRNGNPLTPEAIEAMDGPALLALCNDAQAKVHPRHAANRR